MLSCCFGVKDDQQGSVLVVLKSKTIVKDGKRRDISDQQDNGVDVDVDVSVDESALIDDIGKVIDIVEGAVQVSKRRKHEAEKLKAKSPTGGTSCSIFLCCLDGEI